MGELERVQPGTLSDTEETSLGASTVGVSPLDPLGCVDNQTVEGAGIQGGVDRRDPVCGSGDRSGDDLTEKKQVMYPGIIEVPDEIREKLVNFAASSRYEDYQSLRLLFYLTAFLQPQTVVEFGTYIGCSAAHLAAGMAREDAKVVSVDKYVYADIDKVEKSLTDYGFMAQIKLACADTFTCREMLTEECPDEISMLFMDAAHEYVGLSIEFEQVRYLLANSNVVIVDDLNLLGINQWVNEISQQYPYTIKVPFHKGVAIMFNDPDFWTPISKAIQQAKVPEWRSL